MLRGKEGCQWGWKLAGDSHTKKIKLHLHNKSPTDDVVNCSIIKFFFGLIVEVFLVWTNGLQKLQYVV